MMQLQCDFVRIRYRVPASASSQLRRAVCLQGVDDGRQDRGGWRHGKSHMQVLAHRNASAER